jgi:hypothetical protein
MDNIQIAIATRVICCTVMNDSYLRELTSGGGTLEEVVSTDTIEIFILLAFVLNLMQA